MATRVQKSPQVIIIAGPNGAGKTTLARQLLPREADCTHFVNADLIAAGLSPFDPEEAAQAAGRLMISEIRRYLRLKVSFSFETTLSGMRYSQLIPQWRAAGWFTHLVFLRLPSVEIALKRVKMRVGQGGHSVPDEVVRRRYFAGWNNYLNVYRGLVDRWELFDSSGTVPKLLDEGTNR